MDSAPDDRLEKVKRIMKRNATVLQRESLGVVLPGPESEEGISKPRRDRGPLWAEHLGGSLGRAWPVTEMVDAQAVAKSELAKLHEADPSLADGAKRLASGKATSFATGNLELEARKSAWRNAVRSMVIRLFVRTCNAPVCERVGWTDPVKQRWNDAAKERRVLFLCTERIVFADAPRLGVGADTWAGIDPSNAILPGRLSELSFRKTDLSEVHRQVKRLRSKAGPKAEEEAYYVFVGCVCTVRDRSNKEAYKLYCEGTLDEIHQTSLVFRDKLSENEKAPTGQQLAFHVAGLGFLSADDPCLSITLPSRPDRALGATDACFIPVLSLSCPELPEASGALERFGRDSLLLSDPLRQYNPALARPYLFHYRDAPRGPEDLGRMKDDGHGSEGSVLAFLRFLCAWSRCDEYDSTEPAPPETTSAPPSFTGFATKSPGESLLSLTVRRYVLEDVRLLSKEANHGLTRTGVWCSVKRALCPEGNWEVQGLPRSPEMELLIDVAEAWRDWQHMERAKGSPLHGETYTEPRIRGETDPDNLRDRRMTEAFWHEERMAVWYLVYVFCTTEQGRSWLVRTLESYWRARLRCLEHASALHETVRRADLLENILWSAGQRNHFNLPMESVLDEIVRCTKVRLQLALPVAAQVLGEANAESGKGQGLLPFNNLILQCRSLFSQWHPTFVMEPASDLVCRGFDA